MTPKDNPRWTIETYAAHNEALREAEQKFQEERDRRYAEVSLEREKALKIKEEADKTALGLQRDTQVYKDEKANELRSQIERERGSYATKDDLKTVMEKLEAMIAPLQAHVASQAGGGRAWTQGWSILAVAVVVLVDIFFRLKGA